jgi:replicative DNA helicase
MICAVLAAAGTLVVLTMPRHLVVSDAGLDPAWADVADFILEIDRPDLIDRNSVRPGEADLHLLRNRWGPTRSDVVAFQGHYSRFVEMDGG